MSDLVKRLRENPNYRHWLVLAEAADEIERLSAELKLYREGETYRVAASEIERLSAEVSAKDARIAELESKFRKFLQPVTRIRLDSDSSGQSDG